MAHRLSTGRWLSYALTFAVLLTLAARSAVAKETLPTAAAGNVVELKAQQQRKDGAVFVADGDVDIHYQEMRLRADHAEYNADTNQVLARGHVQFDYQNQQLNGDQVDYNIKTGRGTFEHVHGLLHINRQPNAAVLVTPNPLYFEAESVERLDQNTYRIHQTVMTVCDPVRPIWTFNASEATLHVNQTVALVNANFRILRIPLIYLPYASLPAGRRLRQSGFLLPQLGRSSTQGVVLGDAYYWAISDWADATVGAQLLSLRGSSQRGTLRMRPWENVNISANYFGVIDRGLPGPDGVRVPQGGHLLGVKGDALLDGWHAVANVNQLSSLTFQLVFSPTFNEAVNSEVISDGFLTNNFRGFSINFSASDYKDFLTAQSGSQPETSIVLRTSPEVRFGSIDQSPWKKLPVYFGFDVYSDAVHRSDPILTTASYVSRSEFAPRVTIPLHWGPWLNVTPSYSVVSTRYGAQIDSGIVENVPVWRTAGEFSVDLRPPALERVWEMPHSKWKHTIEPAIVYRYVTGLNDFARFIRIDEDDTLTDTNEIEYSLTQRLFRRGASGGAEELASWSLRQKYYFDPTFGGALAPGQSNLIQALDIISPFGFADGPRRISPLVSDFRITPGKLYDAELRTEYDPARGRISSNELLLKLHPYKDINFTVAQYSINASTVLQPISNQVRMLVGYGALNRKGWNATAGVSYDILQGTAQNLLGEVNYNGACCGVAVGYQRLFLGQLRNENQFRISFIIANLGNFGNLRQQERIF